MQLCTTSAIQLRVRLHVQTMTMFETSTSRFQLHTCYANVFNISGFASLSGFLSRHTTWRSASQRSVLGAWATSIAPFGLRKMLSRQLLSYCGK